MHHLETFFEKNYFYIFNNLEINLLTVLNINYNTGILNRF